MTYVISSRVHSINSKKGGTKYANSVDKSWIFNIFVSLWDKSHTFSVLFLLRILTLSIDLQKICASYHNLPHLSSSVKKSGVVKVLCDVN